MNSIMELLGGGKKKKERMKRGSGSLGGRKRFLREVNWW